MLLEVIERNTKTSIIAPFEFTCRLYDEVDYDQDEDPNDNTYADNLLCQLVKSQYCIELHKELDAVKRDLHNAQIFKVIDYYIDGVILNKRKISFKELVENNA
jgi:hypothetical protein